MTQSEESIFVAELVETYRVRLFRYAYSLTKNRGGAEDLVQETFLIAFEKIEQLRDRRLAYSWLATILKRLFLRSRAPSTLCCGDIEDGCYQDQNASGLEDVLALRQALKRMPCCYREPLMMQSIEGLSVREIGCQLELLPQTVATRLFRARQMLRTMILEEPHAA